MLEAAHVSWQCLKQDWVVHRDPFFKPSTTVHGKLIHDSPACRLEKLAFGHGLRRLAGDDHGHRRGPSDWIPSARSGLMGDEGMGDNTLVPLTCRRERLEGRFLHISKAFHRWDRDSSPKTLNGSPGLAVSLWISRLIAREVADVMIDENHDELRHPRIGPGPLQTPSLAGRLPSCIHFVQDHIRPSSPEVLHLNLPEHRMHGIMPCVSR